VVEQEAPSRSTPCSAATPTSASSRTGRSPTRSSPPTSWTTRPRSLTGHASRSGCRSTRICARRCCSWSWSAPAWSSATACSRRHYLVGGCSCLFYRHKFGDRCCPLWSLVAHLSASCCLFLPLAVFSAVSGLELSLSRDQHQCKLTFRAHTDFFSLQVTRTGLVVYGLLTTSFRTY
jgi:hypothetical protein